MKRLLLKICVLSLGFFITACGDNPFGWGWDPGDGNDNGDPNDTVWCPDDTSDGWDHPGDDTIWFPDDSNTVHHGNSNN
jgi:hypothetical protein